jgi:hypothetical protein
VAAANGAEALRLRAPELLERARAAVAGAGDTAAAAVAAASDDAPEARRFWESGVRPAAVTDVGHTALDAVGLVPVVGDPADALNALCYAGDGDYASAGWSAAGLVPLVGEFVILQKFGRRILVRGGVVQGGRAGADILGRDTLYSLGDGGFLAHELGEDFHTVARHVGRTDEQLAERLLAKPHLKRASTFTTLAEAERCTYANLGANQAEIDAFLASNKDYATFRMDFDHPVGPTMVKQLSNAVDATSVFTLLGKDPGHAQWLSDGYELRRARVTPMSPHKVLISPFGQFFGGYVHQDFADFHSNAWEAVEDFVANEPLEDRQAARSELGQLLANCHTEQELSDAVDRVHLDYHPPGEGFT